MTQSVEMQKITGQFKDKLTGQMFKYHCDEWDLDIYYRASASMRVEAKIMALTQQGKSAEALVESVLQKALKEDGTRMFKDADRATLMNEADPSVIISVASALNNTDDPQEVVAKN